MKPFTCSQLALTTGLYDKNRCKNNIYFTDKSAFFQKKFAFSLKMEKLSITFTLTGTHDAIDACHKAHPSAFLGVAP